MRLAVRPGAATLGLQDCSPLDDEPCAETDLDAIDVTLPCGVFLEWEVLKSRCRRVLEDQLQQQEEFFHRLIRGHAPETRRAVKGSMPSVHAKPLATAGSWVKTECYYNRAMQRSQWEMPDEFKQAAATKLRSDGTSPRRPTPEVVVATPSARSDVDPCDLRGRAPKGNSAFDIRMHDFLEDMEERFGSSALQCRIAHSCARVADWWAHIQEPPRRGCLATIVKSAFFELLCTFAIIAYSVFMVFLANHSVQGGASDPPRWLTLGEQSFTLFFCFEVALRLFVHRMYYFCNTDMTWNIFDLILVLSSIYENGVKMFLEGTQADVSMTFLRSMRLMKMVKALRVLKMLRFVSELRFMINSVMGSFVSLFWCGVMLVMAFFLFSLAFVQGVGAYLLDHAGEISEQEHADLINSFGSVLASMMTCFRCSTGGDDWGAFYDMLEPTGFVNKAVYFFFILFSQIALLNIVTGVFVENAMKLGQPDLNALAFSQRKQDLEDAKRLRHVFSMIDQDCSGTISWREFNDCIRNDSRVRASLAVLGLGINDTASFFKVLTDLDKDADVDLDFFVDACLKMKGNASSIDLQTVAFETKVIHRNLRSFEVEMRSLFAELIAASERCPLGGATSPRQLHGGHADGDDVRHEDAAPQVQETE